MGDFNILIDISSFRLEIRTEDLLDTRNEIVSIIIFFPKTLQPIADDGPLFEFNMVLNIFCLHFRS